MIRMLLIKGRRESNLTPHPAPYRKAGLLMRRTIVLLAAMALTLLVASGVALAATKIGTNGPDTLRGTNGADDLVGLGGNDVLFGLGGRDNLLGGPGKDWVLGGNERRPLEGDKNLVGGSGNDGVLGGLGSDNPLGGSGNARSASGVILGPSGGVGGWKQARRDRALQRHAQVGEHAAELPHRRTHRGRQRGRTGQRVLRERTREARVTFIHRDPRNSILSAIDHGKRVEGGGVLPALHLRGGVEPGGEEDVPQRHRVGAVGAGARRPLRRAGGRPGGGKWWTRRPSGGSCERRQLAGAPGSTSSTLASFRASARRCARRRSSCATRSSGRRSAA